MNKNEIASAVEMFGFSSAVAKSLTNRLESALAKEGSAHSRLKQASASLLALSDKTSDEQESAIMCAIGSLVGVIAEIARDNKTEKAPKAKRENWHDADSAEGKAIIARTAPKPKKINATSASVNADIIAQLLQALGK